MNPVHGSHQTGAILVTSDLSPPSGCLEFGQVLEGADITRKVLVSNRPYTVPGWKTLVLPHESRAEAIAIAKKHMQGCEEVLVLDSAAMPEAKAERLQPKPFTRWAPVRDYPGFDQPWTGTNEQKPWDFPVEVTIPHLDSMDTLPTVVALLRAQSIKPFISIVDTGSRPEVVEQLEAMRAADLEVHFLRFNGVKHSSDFPAATLDLAMSICRSPVLVAQHSDVFLRQHTSLQQLVELCDYDHPAVGFQMTPRDVDGWQDAITHSFAAFHMERMDEIGAGWSLRRAARLSKVEGAHKHHGPLGQFMDTETCMALVMKAAGVKPLFVGQEANWEMTVHPLMKHTRSLTGARLYSPAHAKKAQGWLEEALAEAHENLKTWEGLP